MSVWIVYVRHLLLSQPHKIFLVSAVLSDIAHDKAADAINLKISKVGGITKAKTMRDFAVSAGIPMNIEDTWYVRLTLVCCLVIVSQGW